MECLRLLVAMKMLKETHIQISTSFIVWFACLSQNKLAFHAITLERSHFRIFPTNIFDVHMPLSMYVH